jgi:predicted metal-dependent hydrolase
MLENPISWPPTYTVKRHAKARHVKLRTCPTRGLLITVPQRFSLKHIPSVLEEHRAWIIKQLEKLPSNEWELPDHIDIQSLEEKWKIFYEPCQRKVQLLERPGKELVLIGKFDKQLARAQLLEWLRLYAGEQLKRNIQRLSSETQLGYQACIIRDQKTRWGSCSSAKLISLNYKLILLPNLLMRNVIIHELCHTKFMNHSVRFWALVEKFDPNYRQHRSDLRRAEGYIPKWVSGN